MTERYKIIPIYFSLDIALIIHYFEILHKNLVKLQSKRLTQIQNAYYNYFNI